MSRYDVKTDDDKQNYERLMLGLFEASQEKGYEGAFWEVVQREGFLADMPRFVKVVCKVQITISRAALSAEGMRGVNAIRGVPEGGYVSNLYAEQGMNLYLTAPRNVVPTDDGEHVCLSADWAARLVNDELARREANGSGNVYARVSASAIENMECSDHEH